MTIHYNKAWGILYILLGGFSLILNLTAAAKAKEINFLVIITCLLIILMGIVYLTRKYAVVEQNVITVYAPIGWVRKIYPYDRLLVVDGSLYAYIGWQSTKVSISRMMSDSKDWQALLKETFK